MYTMKFLSYAIFSTLLASASAFAPSPASSTSTSTTALNLFGGGGKKDGAKPGMGGGMMDQLAMFKKAQEMATKKKKLDDELAAMSFAGTSENGKVTCNIKFVPVTNPMDPNPEYEPVGFEFDDEFFSDATPEEIATASKEAVLNGVKATNDAVAQKYQALQGDLMEALGQGKPAEK